MFKTSGTAHPLTLRHIPEGLHLQQQNCDNLRSRRIAFNRSSVLPLCVRACVRVCVCVCVCVCVYKHVFELGDDGRVLQEKQIKGKSNQFLCADFM